MPEIRINSRPCSHCGHRNVTTEERVCERCGTSLIKARNRRYVMGAVLTLVLLASSGILIRSPWSSEDTDWVRQTKNNSEQVQDPVKAPKSSSPADKKELSPPPGKSSDEAKEDVPLMYADEKEDSHTKLNDIAVNQQVPAEAERFSTLTSDKSTISQDYQNLISAARMIASDLDVRVESSTLKEYNNTHFDRVADMLRRPEYQGKELYLVGIAGSVESAFIAKSRAEFARKILLDKYALPIKISTYGFDNTTDEPAIGHRVEVWVK